MKHLAYLNKYIFRYRWRLLLGIVFVTVSNYFGVLSPRVISFSLDLVAENLGFYFLFSGFDIQQSYYAIFSTGLMFFGIVVLLLAVLKGIFMFFMRQTIIVMSRLIEYDLKNDMYQHYQELHQGFYKRNNTGDLMSRITEDVTRVRMYLGPAIMYTINLTVLFIMVISTMLSVNVELTLYTLIPLPILAVSIYYVSNIINKRSERIQSQLSNLTTNAQEMYSGIRVIKSFVQERQVLRFFDKESAHYRHEALGLARVEAFFFPLMLLLIGLSTILTVFIGGRGVIAGSITPGNIAEFVIYVNMLTWPVASLGWVASLVQRAAASQKRINEFMSTPTDIRSYNQEPEKLQGAITFDHVSFTYPDTGIKALQDVSFTLQPGQKMAVIGRTGSGKTTLADLLVRMYDVTGGEIRLDERPIREINLGALREQIGYVPQDVFLFSDTVKGNIAFGVKQYNDEAITASAQEAAIHNEITDLSNSYNTVVGERGVTLSGGQKQRISIARAFMKDPRIILMDDCLSAVDANTEKTILKSIQSVVEDKTAIIITHRIFSLINFDKIIVLDKGRIAEEGTHAELLARKGLYYELYEKQKKEEKISS